MNYTKLENNMNSTIFVNMNYTILSNMNYTLDDISSILVQFQILFFSKRFRFLDYYFCENPKWLNFLCKILCLEILWSCLVWLEVMTLPCHGSILIANDQRIKSRFPKETCDISKLKILNFTRKMNSWIGSVGTKNIELKTWSTDQYCRIHVPSIVEFMLWDLYNSCRNMNYTKLEKNMNYTTGRGFRFLYNSCKF